jgi:hypothetical protein
MRVEHARRGGGAPRRAWARAAGLGGTVLLAVGCALGPAQDPGCLHDAECGDGYTCRNGACFEVPQPADAGADGG